MQTQIRNRRIRIARIAAAVGVLVTAVGMLLVPAQAVSANAGTVKIDGVDVDDLNPNEPHPVCDFTLQFFGFESGLAATYTFSAVPPAGNKVLVTGDVDPIDGDPTTEFVGLADALDDPALFKHPTQGYHVHVDIATWPATNPDDQTEVKSKTFWVECEIDEPPVTEPPVTEPPVTEPPVTDPPVTTGSVSTEPPPVSVIDTVVERPAPVPTTAAPAPTTVAPAQIDTLPVTGPSSASYMAIMAGLLLAVGSGLYLTAAEVAEARQRA